jgi:hypothetical protein
MIIESMDGVSRVFITSMLGAQLLMKITVDIVFIRNDIFDSTFHFFNHTKISPGYFRIGLFHMLSRVEMVATKLVVVGRWAKT